MLVLYSYPGLFGLADNNPVGLKVFAVLTLGGIAFRQEQIVDASDAPRGQLPYILDRGRAVGDSDAIVRHLVEHHGLALDRDLTRAQRDTDLLVRRTLDDLYWVMSYSRWQDERYWPLFRDAFLAARPDMGAAAMEAARSYNRERYRHQGIGRFQPEEAYARGLADLEVLARLIPDRGFVFGTGPTSLDAALYGWIANILFFEIDTPLRRFVRSAPQLERHCRAVHAAVTA